MTPCRVSGVVSAPKAIYLPDTEYSEEARKTMRVDLVALSLVVGPNGNGITQNPGRRYRHGTMVARRFNSRTQPQFLNKFRTPEITRT
jgi:hypothetical protein